MDFFSDTDFEVIQSRIAFDALQEEWNALASATGCPFARHDWFAAALDAFHADRDPFILILRRNGTLVSACPLVPEKSGPLTLLTLAGGRALNEPCILPHADRESLTQLMQRLLQQPCPVLLPRVRQDGPELRALNEVRGRHLLRPAADAYWLPIGGSWDSHLKGLSSKRRKRLTRGMKLAREMGSVAFESLAPNAEQIDVALDRFFAVEDSGWKRDEGLSIRANPQLTRFFSDVARAAAARGELRLYFLTIDGRDAAGEMDILMGERLWALKFGFDDAYARCSPGQLVVGELFRHLHATQQLTAYEFTGSAEPWEAFWNPKLHQFRYLRLYPSHPVGLFGWALDAIRYAIKDAIHHRVGVHWRHSASATRASTL